MNIALEILKKPKVILSGGAIAAVFYLASPESFNFIGDFSDGLSNPREPARIAEQQQAFANALHAEVAAAAQGNAFDPSKFKITSKTGSLFYYEGAVDDNIISIRRAAGFKEPTDAQQADAICGYAAATFGQLSPESKSAYTSGNPALAATACRHQIIVNLDNLGKPGHPEALRFPTGLAQDQS